MVVSELPADCCENALLLCNISTCRSAELHDSNCIADSLIARAGTPRTPN